MEIKDDPKVSLIVPVYDVPQDVFKRCLVSIADQDYGNLEVVIVPNGGDKDAEDFALAFSKDRPNWTVLATEKKGACFARNYGFQHSTGEIVAFVNSDYILKTGIVRLWVDELLKHPDCGFVYGAYEYNTAQRDVYWSKPFDVFQLEVANYIDCGFPLWRKHVVEWDENCKSLQDWDFWLRVVKSGVKGHYLGREISFIAEAPRPKGLSEDSATNWLERVRYVKDKHGIPNREICVMSIGAANHGVEIAKMLGADYRDDTLHKPHAYRAGYIIGWYMHPSEKSSGHSTLIHAFRNSNRIVHFVGADIYWLREFPVRKIKEFAGALKLSTTAILCENELAQKELASYGIDAEIVPIPPYSDFRCEPLPEEFSVSLYLTDKSNFDKYLTRHTLSIVKAMPDVKFYGYGDWNGLIPGDAAGTRMAKFEAKNFEHKGYLTRPDWEQFVKDTSCYLRLVRHDTRPLATDEYLMAGRSVVTNIPNEYVDYVDTSGKAPYDSWDTFGAGFTAIRWPNTKKKIVQTIRKVRKAQEQGGNEFEGERLARSIALRSLLDKDRYRRKIRELALQSPALEVVA
jgi:glycosyltransferase involved in cell wall biosynthesis